MGLDPSTTTVVAALLSCPTVSRIVSAKDRKRLRPLSCRVQLLDHVRWLRRFQVLHNPVTLWTEPEPSKTTTPNTFNLFPSGIHPVVTGILLSGITAFVLHVAGSVDAIKHFSAAPINVIQETAAKGGTATLGAGFRASFREIEAGIDTIVVNATPGDPTLTKEELATHQARIHELYETVLTSYYNERDRSFSREDWAKIRDEALRQRPKAKAQADRIFKQMVSKGLKEDPYAKLISPSEFREMQKYDMTGVGFNIGSSDDYYRKVASKQHEVKPKDPDAIWVLGLLQGSAAEKAGIQQGDQVLAIDGVGVSGLTSYEVSQKIKETASNAEVQLTIRSKATGTRVVAMQTSINRLAPPVSASIESGFFQRFSRGSRRLGRIAVSNFNSDARKEIMKALDYLEQEKVDYMILDLRGNPGGLVDEAAEIAKLYLAKGSRVYVKRMGGQGNESEVVSHQRPRISMGLAVQVDDRTASAAEIVAGAIQDNCRGVVIGRDRTFGKGLIQSIFQLQDGSGLRLTAGKYYTPNMTDIDQLGISPDFSKLPSRTKADEALQVCRLRQGRKAG